MDLKNERSADCSSLNEIEMKAYSFLSVIAK